MYKNIRDVYHLALSALHYKQRGLIKKTQHPIKCIITKNMKDTTLKVSFQTDPGDWEELRASCQSHQIKTAQNKGNVDELLEKENKGILF